MKKTGVLLVNLGTPDHCDRYSVYRYLREFLSDPRVIDLPKLVRWPLVNLLIAPFRSRQSSHAYQKIWTKNGSPLLENGLQLKSAVQNLLGDTYQVELGMRYGKPTIADAAAKLAHCDKLVCLPLFPQYSSAATGSAIEKTLQVVSRWWNLPDIHIINDFYDHAGFIQAYAELIKTELASKQVDQLIFSYHGLPERHIQKSQCHAACDRVGACPEPAAGNAYCYRAQCFQTSTLLAQALGLKANQYHVAFQSRLGRTPWIKPYTDHLLPSLRQQGVTNIAVACPSFVADCLETLEEVNLRLREQWKTLGGQSFYFIPCLNARPSWVQAIANLVR